MEYTNLADHIEYSPLLFSKHIMKEWQRVKPILELKHITSVREITPLYAEKYKFDLHGLFRDILMIDKTFIYPHIIINGYDSSTCYDGNRLKFSMLSLMALTKYHRLFTRNYDRDVELGKIIPV